jgi:hypothetical protein
MYTSPTWSAEIPAFLMAAAMAVDPREVAETLESDPRKLPMGVRCADAMMTFLDIAYRFIEFGT